MEKKIKKLLKEHRDEYIEYYWIKDIEIRMKREYTKKDKNEMIKKGKEIDNKYCEYILKELTKIELYDK